MSRYVRVVNLGCLLATSVAFGAALLETTWWLVLGKRAQAFARSLDHYFADELQRLQVVLAAEKITREHVT